jgi:hypothetical protein
MENTLRVKLPELVNFAWQSPPSDCVRMLGLFATPKVYHVSLKLHNNYYISSTFERFQKFSNGQLRAISGFLTDRTTIGSLRIGAPDSHSVSSILQRALLPSCSRLDFMNELLDINIIRALPMHVTEICLVIEPNDPAPLEEQLKVLQDIMCFFHDRGVRLQKICMLQILRVGGADFFFSGRTQMLTQAAEDTFVAVMQCLISLGPCCYFVFTDALNKSFPMSL